MAATAIPDSKEQTIATNDPNANLAEGTQLPAQKGALFQEQRGRLTEPQPSLACGESERTQSPAAQHAARGTARMAEQWLAKSCVKAKWEAVASTMTEEGEVDGATFVDAAKTIITIFDLITGMSIPKGDMDGNATTLGKNLGAGQSVQACILAELKTGDLKKLIADGTKSTCAALWLVRALFFIKGMIQALLNDKDVPEAKKKSLKDCVLEGYKDSLAPHHGFMTKGVFQVRARVHRPFPFAHSTRRQPPEPNGARPPGACAAPVARACKPPP